MKPDDVLNELQNYQNDIPIFRKLIGVASFYDSTDANVKEWQAILAHIIEIISNNSELGNERILLACHALHTLLLTLCDSHTLKVIVIGFQRLDSHDLCFFEKRYTISDLELFKLLSAYGYLQVNRKDVLEPCFEYDALLTMFDVIYRNCMTYTRYTYFAYKVLSGWLKRLKNTTDVRFWDRHNRILEQKLEAIIFSNWSNTLNNLCKQNAEIFNMYLQIMLQKYKEAFVDNVYHMCLKDMSWQNETKYVILAEILQVHNIRVQTMKNSLFELCDSLTRNSLRCGGTKLYLTILRKLSEAEWKEMFGEVMKFIIDRWESEKHENHNAFQSLFKYWLEPTIGMYKNILSFLWELCGDTQGYFFRSHLQRIAAKEHVELPQTHEIEHYINDKEDIIRLNAFAVLCYRAAELIDINKALLLIKQFLWFNANTATILMREGIIKYFRILWWNILKTASIKADCVQSLYKFIDWLHEYFLDCFEIGSCYQRKILAVNLYKTLLSFINENLHKSYTLHKKYLHYINPIDKMNRCLLISNLRFKFIDKESLLLLLRLVLDSALDIRQLAGTLVLEYFEKDALSITEKSILYNCAWEHCNSSKFYKIESGAVLIKIIAHWLPLNGASKDATEIFTDNEYNNILAYSSYSEFLLNEAECQLTQMKSDILKAIVENRPFYGVMTALLAVAFRGGPENWILTLQFTEKILNLLKDAVDFFLSMFSIKASNTVYSSSFAEMGLAIDERIKTSAIEDFDYDELQLSSAHQVLISCIWMSLKISCEIASEIGMLMQSNAQVKCSIEMIVTVLLKCRHKGVVECAGLAIANLSKCLYNKEEYSELPKTYLTCLLEEDTGKSLHLTRRGAGLTIMFHRLVVSDNRRDRPTVHFAAQTLLHSLENFSAVRNVEAGEDSPWAKRLHFLRALVTDKEIHAQLVPYMEDICLTCFKYMESDVWAVRNASLQLYGAVVPRLVGQCTGKGDEAFDFGDGYSVNHFVTHYPMLTSRIWTQLQDVSKIRGTSNIALRSYSSIVHTLILLSKLSMSGCDLVDYPARVFITKFKRLLLVFLGNPMIHVRQLAAKAYTALTSFNSTDSEIKAIRKEIFSSHDVNMLHGCLLTCGYLREKFIHDTRSICPFHEIEDYSEVYWTRNFGNSRYVGILEAWIDMCKHKKAAQPCYILETLFLRESYSCINFTDRFSFPHNFAVSEYVVNTSSQKIQPGFFQFVGYCEQLHATYLKSLIKSGLKFDDYKQEIHDILNFGCVEQGSEFLKSLSYCIPSLKFILKYLVSIRSNCHQLLLDEIIMFTLRTIRHASLETKELEFDEIIEEFNKAEIPIANSNIIRVKNSLILAFSKRETLINRVLSDMSDICMDEKQSARLTAAEYIELVLHRFAQLEDGNKLIIMRCCLILLKDEITEIREIVSTCLQTHMFRKYVSSTPRRLQHEEIVYQRFLSDVIRRHIANDNVDFVQYFTHAIRDGDSNVTIENPFHHNDSIFHKEESKFLNICFLYDTSGDNRSVSKDSSDVIQAIQTRHFRKLQEKAGFNYDDLRVILYLKETDYMVQKRDAIMQQWK